MSILKRGNSKFWYIQFQLRGKTYIRSSRTTSKKIAEQMEAEWKSKLHAHQYRGEKPRISMGEAIQQFCDSKKGTPNHRNLRSHYAVICQFFSASKFIDELTVHDLERFKRHRESQSTSGQTIKHSLNLIRCGWKYVRRLGYQVSDIEFPVVKVSKHQLRYLSKDEERKLLEALDPKREVKGLMLYRDRPESLKRAMQDAYDLVVVLLDTGARYSEIANIEWVRIDLPKREINLWRPKVQNEAVLYMTDRVYEILKRRSGAKTSQWVFQNKKGGARGYASQAIRKAIRKAGLDGCRIHTLRHTHATRLIQNGLTVYEVREILGHTDIKTTMRYAHLETRQVTSKARDVINQLNNE